MGWKNTYFRLKQSVWWPGMQDDIREYVTRCKTCQKRQGHRDQEYASSVRITPEPFHHIGVDAMGPLPRTITGKRYIVLAMDFFTKWPEAEAVEEADAQTIVKFLHTNIITRHGVPKEITSDRGTEFLNTLVTEFERTYRIKHIKITAYHPQGNGQTERTNRTIKDILSKVSGAYTNWVHYLESALFAIRTARQKSTTFSPAELVYGRTLKREFHVSGPDHGTYEDRIWKFITRDVARLTLIRKKAAIFIDKAQENQRKRQDRTFSAERLVIGDQVVVYRSITESSWSAKTQAEVGRT